MDDEGSARKGGSSMSGRVASAAPVSEPPLLTGADGNAVKMLEELRTEDLKGLPALPPESTMRTVLELLRSDDWGAHVDSINLLRRLVAWADELDPVSPAADARAISARAPHAELRVTDGIPHADLGMPAAHGAGTDVTSARSPSRVPPPSAPAPPSAA